MFGQPALGAGLVAGDAQRVALLAEQRIAAVPGAKAFDEQFFGEVHDEATVRIQLAGGVQTLHEPAGAGDQLQRGAAHPGHDVHVQHHIGAVGDLNAIARQR